MHIYSLWLCQAVVWSSIAAHNNDFFLRYICQLYGSSEALILTTTAPLLDTDEETAGVGVLLPYVEMKVIY
jgi:hypothetical protein